MTSLKILSVNPFSSFGAAVAQMRHGRGLKQAELAKRVELSASHLSNIEHARSAPPTEDLARRLARELSLTLGETKTFVAEANLARSQWHAERVRSRARRRADQDAVSEGVRWHAGQGEAAMEDLALRVTSQNRMSTQLAPPSLTDALTRECAEASAGFEGDGRDEAASCPPGAFSIAAQTVRLDIDLPQIGAACLEIDVSTHGSDCRLAMRVVPRPLERERRP
jgi:transcriptional regulator with XRE-family HTH domain